MLNYVDEILLQFTRKSLNNKSGKKILIKAVVIFSLKNSNIVYDVLAFKLCFIFTELNLDKMVR